MVNFYNPVAILQEATADMALDPNGNWVHLAVYRDQVAEIKRKQDDIVALAYDLGSHAKVIQEQRAEIKRLHTAYEQERQDCINLTEKVIPGLRDEIKRLREELNRTRNAVDIVADAKNTEIEQLRKDFTDLLRLAANDASEHQAKIERLREGWAETNSTLLSRNIEIVGLKDENERLRGELAEKDDYIKTVSRPIGAHSYE